MKELNLTANGAEQELILLYLQANASNILAEKINNGTTIEKDGKTLVSRKTLDGFLFYACEEARKLAEKGAKSACVEDKTVFGWAIHYFEEDSIEGTLYNTDGTEFKPMKPKYEPKATTAPIVPSAPKPKPQLSFFDLGIRDERKEPEPEDESDEISEEEQQEILRELAEEEAKQNESDEDIDIETGEILTETEMRKFDGDIEEPKELLDNSMIEKPTANSPKTIVDNKFFNKLSELLGNIIIAR